MKLSIAEKLKFMRESERLTSRPAVAKMLGIGNDALWRYEVGKSIPSAEIVIRLLSLPAFEKYALWFTTGKTAPESGQVAPALYDPKNYENDEKKLA
ncbi:helix-turn-helix transcriptional regulator [Xenorhabdus sp. PB30.3]|uniref:helix-turn-helix domain-containing protein n=1 Tax=Xenorhabdus sp. PB30.3 TaxID=2788941 RepID=UPI001E466942|nr:helix-turn-helix transcriptional regulator [Xenorhabdus sp. PB30.3]MCC8380802.1 helix-turn-helix transcriptional regulator [Xenorhabdus sp. PB30.3]